MTTKDARSEFERRLAEDRKRIKKLQEERAREAAAKEAAERAERQKKAQEALKMLGAKEEEKKPERPALPATHVVEAGDTLSAIALKYYGNAALWTEIYKVNKKVIGDNPSKIFVGQKLTIPQL